MRTQPARGIAFFLLEADAHATLLRPLLTEPLRADAVEELRARGEAYAAANVVDTGRGA